MMGWLKTILGRGTISDTTKLPESKIIVKNNVPDRLTPQDIAEFINLLADEVDKDEIIWNHNRDVFVGENWSRPYNRDKQTPTISLYENTDDNEDGKTLSLWIDGHSLGEILDLKNNDIYRLANKAVSRLHQALQHQIIRYGATRVNFVASETTKKIKQFIETSKDSVNNADLDSTTST